MPMHTQMWMYSVSLSLTWQALLYGGADEEGPLGDAWLLDMEAGSWVGLSTTQGCSKAWHSAEYLTTGQGRYVVVYGGEANLAQPASSDQEVCFSLQPTCAPLECPLRAPHTLICQHVCQECKACLAPTKK